MMVRVPSNREPTHPGEMLAKEFLEPMGITQRDLSDGIHVPYQRVNEIVNGRRGITASTALRLAKFFGNSDHTSSAFSCRSQHHFSAKRAHDFPPLY